MKKTLAIVLALVMVLAMIPAMSAATLYHDVKAKSYEVEAYTFKADGTYTQMAGGSDGAKVNAATVKYDWEDLEKVYAGKWNDETVVGVVELKGFATNDQGQIINLSEVSVKVDGLDLVDADEYTSYGLNIGYVADGQINFPVELTKAGYSDKFTVVLTGKYTSGEDTVVYTETAVVSVTFKNTAEYKNVKTAVVTDIQSSDPSHMTAYIVGSKIYLDFVDENAAGVADETLKVTFADENKAAFTAVTWAYTPVVGKLAVVAGENTTVQSFAKGYEGWTGNAVKLEKSAANYQLAIDELDAADKFTFKLETQSALYETKKYDVVVRKGVKLADPKGIHFAETVKTIAMGEEYTPVVLGVATGKAVDATITISNESDKNVLDTVDYNTVIGTREGVAYLTASYNFFDGANGTKEYKDASMKVVVTLPGESIPALDPAVVEYKVTCRALNVRAGAGTSYKKVDLLKRGETVKVVEIANGWAELSDGTYVCAKYIAK